MTTSPPTDQQSIRRQNRRLILDCLRLAGPLSRAELARQVGLTKSTISSLIGELVAEGCLREGSLVSSPLGRPGTLIELAAENSLAAGAELGVDNTVLVLSDLKQQAHGLWEWPEDSRVSLEQRLATLTRTFHQHISGRSRLLGLGLSVPGVVSRSHTLVYAPGLGWRNENPAQTLSQALRLPVWLFNDANASALGETFWAGGRSPLVYVMVGTGLGVGLVIDGQIYSGQHGAAGEIGHWLTRTLPHRGPDLEDQISLRSVMENYRQHNQGRTSWWGLLERARLGEAQAITALHHLGDQLGYLLANLAVAYDPAEVVLGGAGAEAWPWLETPIRERLAQLAFIPQHTELPVRPGAFGHLAPAMGAAAHVLQRFLANGAVWERSPPISPLLSGRTIGAGSD